MTAQAAKTKKIFDGRYEILSIVGRGARSVVYQARTLATPSSEVALKVLLEQKGKSSSGERLRKEALALVSSRHRYVIRLDDFHSVGSLCYLSMEYAPEADLRRYLYKLGTPLSIEVAERFLLQVAEALSFVHKAGIIHRDVKPDNILVLNDHEVRLGDFGVAVLPGETASLEELQNGVGTMNYLAPEVLEGKSFDQRADLYALAVTFYEALSGKNPFENISLAEQVGARSEGKIPSLRSLRSEIPEYLDTVIMQAMSFEPASRFESVRDFVQAILVNKAAGSRIEKSPSDATSTMIANISDVASADEPIRRDVADTVVSPSSGVPAVAPTIEATQVIAPQTTAEQTEEPGSTQAVPPRSAAPASSASDAPNTPSEVTQTVVAPAKVVALAKKSDAPGVANRRKPKKSDAPPVDDVTQTTFVDKNAVKKMQAGGSKPLPYVPSTAETPNASGLKKLALVGAALLVLVVIVPGLLSAASRWFPSLGRDNKHSTATPDPAKAAAAPFQSPIPKYVSRAYTFPDLPSGIYTGSISELLPGRTLPLVLISDENKDDLAIIVGLEGWTPAVINPRARLAQSGNSGTISLRVSSGGIILELTGQEVDGEIFGYFRNVVNGVQGEWRARPLDRPKNRA